MNRTLAPAPRALPCPRCFGRFSLAQLDTHLRFTCPVLRLPARKTIANCACLGEHHDRTYDEATGLLVCVA